MTILAAEHVGRDYPQPRGVVRALDNVSLAIEAGEHVTVTGASGSGKSTLLAILGLMERPTRGRVVFRGDVVSSGREGGDRSVSASRLAALRLEHMGFVFQDFRLLRHASALDNVRLPLEFAGASRATSRVEAERWLDRVGLGDRAHRKPGELSRGEMQRVALARALVHRPAIVFADEPTANLDRANAERVHELFAEFVRDDGLTVVVATHHHDAARGGREVRLREGVVES